MIRPATPADAAALASLAGQLGYPADARTMVRRLARIVDAGEGVVLVALGATGEVCGFARALPQQFVVEEPFAELAALVVDADSRRAGVGKALLAAVEAWARQRGLRELVIRSNVVRERAHRFYLREGYVEKKRQAVFGKGL